MRGSVSISAVILAMPASRVALSGHSIHAKATVSSSFAATAPWKSVVCPGLRSAPQHSTTRSAPCSRKTGSTVLAWRRNSSFPALGTGITKPSKYDIGSLLSGRGGGEGCRALLDRGLVHPHDFPVVAVGILEAAAIHEAVVLGRIAIGVAACGRDFGQRGVDSSTAVAAQAQ